MTISFPHYPSTNRVPGFFYDVSPARANTAQQNLPVLLIGQVAAGSAAVPGVPVISQGVAADTALCGQGSMLALMVATFRAQNLFSTVWLLPLADDPAAVVATGTILFAGSPGASGTVPLYLAGQRVLVAVAAGATATTVASMIAAQINAQPSLPVTAATNATAGAVVLTAKNKGAIGNDCDIRFAYLGAAGGEVMPPGLTATVTPMAGGATNPALALPFAALADLPFEVIVCPYTDSASTGAVATLMNDVNGRWAWSRQLYGHAYSAFRGNLGTATTLGLSLNDQHLTVLPIYDTPDPMFQVAASLGAGVSASVNTDPAQPLGDLPLNVQPPPPISRFGFGDRNSLLYEGMSTYKVDQGGQLYTERLVTTYQTNPSGVPDTSYLDCETMHTLGAVIRDLHSYLATTFVRRVLVDDTTRIPAGSNLVSPSLIKVAVISRYRFLESQGLVQQSSVFAQQVQALNAGNGQVSLDLPIILVNQLRQVVGLVDFSKP